VNGVQKPGSAIDPDDIGQQPAAHRQQRPELLAGDPPEQKQARPASGDTLASPEGRGSRSGRTRCIFFLLRG